MEFEVAAEVLEMPGPLSRKRVLPPRRSFCGAQVFSLQENLKSANIGAKRFDKLSSMPLYFYVLEHHTFHRRLRPALTASWRTRSFAPCRSLAADFATAIRDFQQRFHIGPEELLITRLDTGLAFDRRAWRLLVGELLMVCAVEIPEIETSPETLAVLLQDSQTRPGTRSSIEQAHFGSRDLAFGAGYYRPEHAGWNDLDDVRRLSEYLATIDPQRWQIADLAPLTELVTDEERAEELDYVREWWPPLVDLYGRAAARSHVIVCERL